jgi:branched-chain amino acid transport system substrate-binding protein
MVEEEKIIAIYNEHAPTSLDAVAPYLESKGVPFVGSVPGSTPIDKSPMSFFPSTGDRGTGWAHILPLLQFPGKHKIATFYCREVNGCKIYNDMVKQFSPKIGSEVIFSAQVSLAQPDYTAEVLAAKNAGADALVTIVENASTVRIARSAHQQGWSPIITVQHTGHSQSLLQNPDGEGIATSSTTADWAAAEEMRPYRDAVARYQPGGELGGFGAAAWAAGKVIEAASVKLSDSPTSAELIEGFFALRNETLGGIIPPITFPRQGTREAVNECVVIGVVKKGRLVTPGPPNQFTCAPGWKPVS